jgi:guanylate kinase
MDDPIDYAKVMRLLSIGVKPKFESLEEVVIENSWDFNLANIMEDDESDEINHHSESNAKTHEKQLLERNEPYFGIIVDPENRSDGMSYTEPVMKELRSLLEKMRKQRKNASPKIPHIFWLGNTSPPDDIPTERFASVNNLESYIKRLVRPHVEESGLGLSFFVAGDTEQEKEGFLSTVDALQKMHFSFNTYSSLCDLGKYDAAIVCGSDVNSMERASGLEIPKILVASRKQFNQNLIEQALRLGYHDIIMHDDAPGYPDYFEKSLRISLMETTLFSNIVRETTSRQTIFIVENSPFYANLAQRVLRWVGHFPQILSADEAEEYISDANILISNTANWKLISKAKESGKYVIGLHDKPRFTPADAHVVTNYVLEKPFKTQYLINVVNQLCEEGDYLEKTVRNMPHRKDDEDGIGLIVTGFPGAGKNRIVFRAADTLKSLNFDVRHTSRPMRGEKEKEGGDYYFHSEEEFLSLVEKGIIKNYIDPHQPLYKLFFKDFYSMDRPSLKGADVATIYTTAFGDMKKFNPDFKVALIGTSAGTTSERRTNRPYRENYRNPAVRRLSEVFPYFAQTKGFDLFLLNDTPFDIYEKSPIQSDYASLKKILAKIGAYLTCVREESERRKMSSENP